MKPIVITTEKIDIASLEALQIAILVGNNGCRVHIRKKGYSNEEIDNFCANLVSTGVDRSLITLHGSLELVKKYGFGGVHLPLNMADKSTLPEGVLLSVSCHTVEEAERATVMGVDYLFLSPIFDSVSKKGYLSAHKPDELREWLKQRVGTTKIVALGGITRKNISLPYEWGFDGVALLGTIWQGDSPTDAYQKSTAQLTTNN